jgi:hypothetical protein
MCGLALVLASCAVSADEPSAPTPGEVTASTAQEIVIPRALGFAPRAETCTDTFGACKVGACELGPHDTFQRITEVCCDANGQNCETELYRLCGC